MVIWAGKRVNKFRNVEAAGLQTKNDNKTCILKYFINPLTSRWVGRGGRGGEEARRDNPKTLPKGKVVNKRGR